MHITICTHIVLHSLQEPTCLHTFDDLLAAFPPLLGLAAPASAIEELERAGAPTIYSIPEYEGVAAGTRSSTGSTSLERMADGSSSSLALRNREQAAPRDHSTRGTNGSSRVERPRVPLVTAAVLPVSRLDLEAVSVRVRDGGRWASGPGTGADPVAGKEGEEGKGGNGVPRELGDSARALHGSAVKETKSKGRVRLSGQDTPHGGACASPAGDGDWGQVMTDASMTANVL